LGISIPLLTEKYFSKTSPQQHKKPEIQGTRNSQVGSKQRKPKQTKPKKYTKSKTLMGHSQLSSPTKCNKTKRQAQHLCNSKQHSRKIEQE